MLPSMERFQVSGNVLKLTPRFDPRYQSRAGMEMMNIVSSLASGDETKEVVLDISEARQLPSVLIGMLCEARGITDAAGKRLKIRLKTATYNRLHSLGLAGVFSPSPADGAASAAGTGEGDGSVLEELELLPDAAAPQPD